MKADATSVFLAGNSVRLFKREDRPTRFWQAAFRRPGAARPLVKSTGQADLPGAKRWALAYLTALDPAPTPVQDEAGAEVAGGSRENLLSPYPFPKIRQEKRHVERELALRALAAYAGDPLISQRRLAQALNVSLAVVNVYTARCAREGWLLKLARPPGQGSGYRYLLTDSGRQQLDALMLAFVADELSFYRRLRGAFTGLLARHPDADVIVAGSGDIAEIARSVLLEAGQVPLLSVTEDQLHELNRHAVKRHRHHAVIWLADLGRGEVIRNFAARHLPDMKVLAPDLLHP